MKRIFAFLSPALLFVLPSCKKDALSPFEKTFAGQWKSVSYTRGSVDHSGEYKADLSLKDDGGFTLGYQYQESAFSYVLTYEQKGSWSGVEAEQEISLREKPGFWSAMTARMAGADSLQLTGTLDGAAAEIIFKRQ